MTSKVSNINEARRKQKGYNLDEAAKAAVRRFVSNPNTDSIKEPQGLASGKAKAPDDFINTDQEDGDNE